MRFALFLFLLLSLTVIIVAHPWGDLSHRHHRHRRAEEKQTETEGECFFAKKRTSPYEKPDIPRPSYSEVSANCRGTPKRMSELFDVTVNNLYQSPNYPALMLFRGAGIFDIDWTNTDQVDSIGKKWICPLHESELGRNWQASHSHRHYKTKNRKQEAANRNTKRSDSVCGMPPPFFQHEGDYVLDRELHFIEMDEAIAILKTRHVLIHPGLPVCPKHNEEARQILAQATMESTGSTFPFSAPNPVPVLPSPDPSPAVVISFPDPSPVVIPPFPVPAPAVVHHSIVPNPSVVHHSLAPYPSGEVIDLAPYPSGEVIDLPDDSDPDYVPPKRENKHSMGNDFIHPPNFPPGVKTAYEAWMQSLGLDAWIATKDFHELNERTQRKKVEAFSIASDAMAHFMAPEDPFALKARAWKGTAAYERPRPKAHAEMMFHVKGAFELAPSRAEKIAALSMVSYLTLSEIQRFIPGLSRYYFNDARKYAARGYHLVEHKIRRMRYSKPKIDRWLQVVTSYKVTLNSPVGVREVKDSTGTWIQIPNTIRLLRAGEIYRVYKKDLTDTNDLALLIPESTHRKLLKVLSAERRKSLHGVDIIIADAMEVFDRAGIAIEKMLESRWIGNIRHGNLRSEMLASRQYLRTDYLIHTKEHSTTGDHCWSYALSDPDDVNFQIDCKKPTAPWYHKHSRVCSQCENVDVWLEDMRSTVKELLEMHKTNPTILHEIQLLERDITDWDIKIQRLKAHQLRTAKSENDRQWIVAGLKPNEVMLTLDWAMKAMPFHGRESTADWYGQRGMPWHVGSALTVKDGEFFTHNFIHLFHGIRQDSVAVTAIVRNILEQLAAVQIRRVFIRSDQAGCYKSSSTIASIKAIADDIGIEVAGWYFSEAQAGKGPCDRCAAVCKGDVRGYADSGKSVTNPFEFLQAVTHDDLIRTGYSYQIVRLEGSGEDKEPLMSRTKIPDLSKYNAFTFEDDGLRVYRYWNIGAGKKIPYTNFDPNDSQLVVEPKGHGGAESGTEYWAMLGEPRVKKQHTVDEQQEEEWEEEEEEEDEDSVCLKEKDLKKCKVKKEAVSAIYRCHIEHCAKEFLSEKNLEKHLTVNKHLRKPEVENVLDYALHHYSSFLEAVFPPQVCPVIDEALTSLAEDNKNGVEKKMGWALSKRQRSKPFPKTVKDFLRKIYDEGAKSGAKVDAREAEELMRVATNPGGGMLFAIDDLLTSRQIAGVYAGFKRTALVKRGKVAKKTQMKKKLSEEEDEGEPMEVDEEEEDEVNALFDTEGDPELEYETEPLFDEDDAIHRAILAKHDEIFDNEDDDPMET